MLLLLKWLVEADFKWKTLAIDLRVSRIKPFDFTTLLIIHENPVCVVMGLYFLNQEYSYC